MTTLYDASRHEPLSGGAWDEALARATVAQILAEADAAFSPEGLWPVHPLDRDPERPPDCMKPLYHGAAGVIWARQRLAALGAAPLAHDFSPVVADLVRRHRQDQARHAGVAAYMDGSRGAYLIGEIGLNLLNWTLAIAPSVGAALAEAIGATVGDARGLVWGGRGAMLAALFLYERSGEARWGDLVRAHAAALLGALRFDPDVGCRLWSQALYGQDGALLGGLHGFAANAAALLRCRALLPASQGAEIEALVLETLAATAVRQDGLANWPMGVGPTDRPNPQRLMVQQCMGAPGAIQALAGLPPGAEVDALLTQAGALVWQAGPVGKLPGLCHGTPGNGYALLRLYQRTGDDAWLARARAFGLHAVRHADDALAEHGQRKWSVWTGDLGLALFLWDCIDGSAALPMLDVF